ncbi:MAG: acylphosphatase [Candidatus Dormibacteria bacterium]
MDDRKSRRRLRAEIFGHVQGVGFRLFAEREARQRSLHGYVRNRYDGAVEVEAEGTALDLDALLDALRRGPRMARIEDVRVAWSAFKGDLPPFGVRG